MAKKKKQPIHYGRLLKKAIKDKKLMKFYVAKDLKLSRPTLDSRLKDGKFSKAKIELIKKIIA